MTLALARICVRGIVQGVGFRPFVYRIAVRNGLCGWVKNTSGSVDMEVEGPREAVDAFVRALQDELPPLARLTDVACEYGEPKGRQEFRILESEAREGQYQLVPPDIATCADCRRELFDPADSRFRYPFTNCTNCGPRFTIIEDIPYDRPLTTMKTFALCERCGAEYADPLDRRFHAQPNACPACGPRLTLADGEGRPVACEDVVAEAGRRLRAGEILAPKGLGGFHLACDARSAAAVTRLRERKRRPGKPLAVMMRDLDMARAHCRVSTAEAEVLAGPACPIVALCWRPESTVCREVAPGLAFLGVMLPYTPFHHLLLEAVGGPLVMTSGNLSEEPIAIDNGEAVRRLAGIADAFVLHNRDILTRCDDSVVLVEDVARPLRRARGYAPDPVPLPVDSGQLLACGAEEKSTFCLTRGTDAFVSQHIGDLENVETLDHFAATVALHEKLFRVTPTRLVHDLHPEYLSTKWARREAARRGVPLLGVQHHHAHIAACLAEHGRTDRVLGVAFDGTGYGTDGTIWGGEFLACDLAGFERLGHLEPVRLPGGAAAIRKPARMAAAWLATCLPGDAVAVPGLSEAEAGIVAHQVKTGLNAPWTTSAGRLFDGVSALLGVRAEAQFEAQAAMELEMLAHRTDAGCEAPLPFTVEEGESATVRLGPLFAALLAQQAQGAALEVLARRFHATMAEIIVAVCRRLGGAHGLGTVALSGGVFQNRLLLRMAVAGLERAGFEVLTHRLVPCNDGGIAYGQAAVAAGRQA